jgi:transcriptional regulator with XRE-family HTH domain
MRVAKRLNKKFGNRLREAREAAQLTQEELAFRAELHRTYISLLERGIKSPTLETLFKICEALELEPEVLISQLRERPKEQKK